MDRQQQLCMLNLAATLFTHAFFYGVNPTSLNAAGLQGAAYAWKQFCERNRIDPVGLPVELVSEDLHPKTLEH